MSPNAGNAGRVGVAKSWWAAKEAVVAPGAVVFNSTDSVAEPGTSRSGWPSPLTSPTATAKIPAAVVVATLCGAAKAGAVAPGAVVFNSTDTLLVKRLATTRSDWPSPLTSPNATEKDPLPVAKS